MRRLIFVLVLACGNVSTLGCVQVDKKAAEKEDALTAQEAAAMIEMRRELERLQEEYASLSVEKFKR